MSSSGTAHIPILYRLLFTYIEPLSALSGALLCHFNPTYFLRTMSATAIYAPSHQVIFDQLAATYILFAFNEAVLLRMTNDLKMWKALVMGILLCDVVHLYGSWEVMGAAFFRPAEWRGEDWMNLLMLYVPVVVRLCFLGEVGFGREGGKNKKRA
ncbi:hypothetical protein GQ43DRAFT_383348 [Delitschia confertaspora ATCC 74209]|uniref:DUF7704 domain-containing protein n=1 Tax=Delitschia confertaspora ATCC 74209 TaxID=1513339 RepID=A0A9P4MKW7_9PLEO|nr:hypothetical protein GQ43DRAFT_383348 [Delitschia confertaspora ATCC 74209]